MSKGNVFVEFCCKAEQRTGLVMEEVLKEDVFGAVVVVFNEGNNHILTSVFQKGVKEMTL